MQLYRLTDNYKDALDSLHDLLEAGEIDSQSMNDTMEGLEGELKDKAINVALHIKNLRSDLSQLEEAKKEFEQRAKSVKSNIEFFEKYLDTNLQKSGIDELKTDYVQIRYKKLPAIVDITGEVPEPYLRIIPEKREPDKRAISDALKKGEELVFASLITDRTKLDIR